MRVLVSESFNFYVLFALYTNLNSMTSLPVSPLSLYVGHHLVRGEPTYSVRGVVNGRIFVLSFFNRLSVSLHK